MKARIHVPGWGTTILEVESIESELAALKAKYPDKEGITVEIPKPHKYSAEEIAAMNEAEQEEEPETEGEE